MWWFLVGESDRSAQRNERRSTYRGIATDYYGPVVDRFEAIRAHHFGGRAANCNLAVVEENDCVGEARDEIQLVADQKYRQSAARE